MVMPRTHQATQFQCTRCGWEIIRPKFTHGDAINQFTLKHIEGVKVCPNCASKEISSRPASSIKKLNPFASNRWETYINSLDDDF